MDNRSTVMVALALVLPFLSCGCATTHYFPMVVSPVSLGPKEKVIGMGSGTGESLMAAIAAAIKGTGADTMLNIFVDQEESCTQGWSSLICVPTNHIRVFGTLIKYEGVNLKSPFDSNPPASPNASHSDAERELLKGDAAF